MDSLKVKELLYISNRINPHYNKILSKNPELYSYIVNRYNDNETIYESIYRIINNIDIRPVCKYCGKPVKFVAGIGFRECCSVSCSKHLKKEIHIDCSDDIIINEYKESGPRNKTSDKFISEHGYKDYLLNRYSDSYSILETIYRIINNIEEKPKCKICGNPVRLISYEKGFDDVCSDICMRKNEIQISDITDEYIKSLSDTAAYKSDFRGYTALLQYVQNKFGDKFRSYQEAMYLIRNDMNEPPKCPVCGKYIEYDRKSLKKYRDFCCDTCKNIAKRIAWKDRLIQETGYNITLDDDLNFVFNDVCHNHKYFTLTSLMAHNRCMASRINHTVICPICNPERNPETSIETIIKNILDEYNINYVQHCRDIISPKELDFYLPNYNIAIECNGMYWHSDNKKDKTYHVNKFEACNTKGIRLLSFWEYHIIHQLDKVKNIILTSIGLTEKIESENCIVKEIDTNTAKEFLDLYNLHGNLNANIRLGLYYNDELIQVMVFGKLRANKSKNKLDEYELYRMCTKHGYTVINGYNIIFQYFIQNHKFSKIITHIDRSIDNKIEYEKLGFVYESIQKSDYFYYDSKNDIIKSKNSIRKSNIDSDKSDKDYMKCYTCGTLKYVYISE